MNVASELALSQIKNNRKRSVGTVLAIALSTSIVTALMCFATSARHMLAVFLGEDYAEYGTTYTVILFIPIGLLALLIAYMSITCISNIFTASSNKRIQEFGIIKCVGGTKKQIEKIVIHESLWLSIPGIILGLIAGTLIGFSGVGITSHYVTEFNELAKSIIMRPFDVSFSFYISGWTYLFASAVSFIIVLRAAGKPAGVVGKIPAIQCIKGLETANRIKVKSADNGFLEKLFGYDGVVGFTNVLRNKRNYKPTIRSLALGLLLFIMLGGLSSQVQRIIAWTSPDSKEMLVDYCSITDYEIMSDGTEKETYRVPIYPDTYNEINDKLNLFDDNEVYGIGCDRVTYKGIVEQKFLTDEILSCEETLDLQGLKDVALFSVNDALYEKLCERAGVPLGSNLLINSYSFNNNGAYKTIMPYKSNIDNVTLVTANGDRREISIAGILTEENLLEKGFKWPFPDPVRIVVPGEKMRYFDWYCDTEDEAAYNTYARSVLDEYYPTNTEDSYVDWGYSVRISRVDNMVKALNMAVVLAQYVMYGFVILLMLIGLTSVISTLVINIKLRNREFAVLKSVGMTKKSLKKMLYCESLLCLIKAVLPGILFGLLIPLAMNLFIRKMYPVMFTVPWANIICGVILITLIVMGITFVEVKKAKEKSIIDVIRMDTM